MHDPNGFSGRDVFADGGLPPFEIGLRVAEALGFGEASVLREDWTPDQLDAAMATDGWIIVYMLEPDGDLRVKLSIDLVGRPIDVACFPALARRHAVTLAWALDEAAAHDHRYHVAGPDGVAMHTLRFFAETEASYAVRMGPPEPASLVASIPAAPRDGVASDPPGPDRPDAGALPAMTSP